MISSYVEGQITELITPKPDDLILCADGGLLLALEAGIVPHAVIGDMDSLAASGYQRKQLPPGINWIAAPKDKDLTDMGLCIEHAIQRGYNEIVIVGGLGGRLDHTIANLQNLVGYSSHGISISIVDQDNHISLLTDGTFVCTATPEFTLSVFSWSPISEGVTLVGMKYPLTEATLSYGFPIGVSNKILGTSGTITVKKGTLMIVCSREVPTK